jgi:serine/threonine-protein kinase HipA
MEIFVFTDWLGMKYPEWMGTLTVSRTKGRSVFAFEYTQSWLDSPHAQTIDPGLQLYSGAQYLSGDKANFGLFLDSSPDRWGRVLMDRREALMAKAEVRRPNKLFEEDYLLGVYDLHRMGGLRFKKNLDGRFLNDNMGYAAPPWTTLRELEAASLQLERSDLKAEDTIRWINLLIAPGASLGGARPKASVLDEKNELWIAKFPSINDKTDVGAWEMVACKLAEKVGIRMSEARVKKLNSPHHSFLAKRFDRQGIDRLHFASAMTLLGRNDGEPGVSYLELVDFIQRFGANVKEDLEELFKRIVFNIGIKNTDDHLRNHGFLLTPKGWKLSPAFDINPVYFGTGLTLNISETDNSLDFELAMTVAPYFRLKDSQALSIIAQVKAARESWRNFANSLGIHRSEQELMEPAFLEG